MWHSVHHYTKALSILNTFLLWAERGSRDSCSSHVQPSLPRSPAVLLLGGQALMHHYSQLAEFLYGQEFSLRTPPHPPTSVFLQYHIG